MNEKIIKNLKEKQDKIIESEANYIGTQIDYYAEQLKDKKDLYTFRQDADPNYYDEVTEGRIEYYEEMIKMLQKLQAAVREIKVVG